MEKLRRATILSAILLCGCVCLAFAAGAALAQVPAPGQAPPAPQLTDDDCAKCHDGPPADIARAGESHQDVACSECHESHRPRSENNIPACSQCHEGEKHFELKGCLTCHTNPHTPLIITLAGDLTDPCLTCHDKQIKKLTEHKSKHSGLFCSKCHDVHGKIPECLQCHKPHAEGMVQTDCSKCHQAHMPTVVTYDEKALNKDCGACHKKAFELLSATKTKHGTKACVFCHKAKHKTILPCTECHGEAPHPQGILSKFTKCGDCHYIAHDLNNWANAAKKTPAKKAPARKK